jgi:hypothetical protein
MQILTTCNAKLIDSGNLPVSAIHLLALTWATLKAIIAQQRQESLQRELATITSKLGSLTMPSASVVQLKQALKLIYFAQGTALEDEISRVHNAVLQLLPYDAQSRATIKVIITGDDASQHIPEVLCSELQHMTTGQDIASDIPPSMSSQTWSSTSSISSEEFPPLPTVPKTSDVWQLSSKVSAPRPPQRPITIHLPRSIDPVTQQKSTITAVAYQALSNRTQLRDTDWDVIPDAFSHLADNIAYDVLWVSTIM